MIKLAELLTTAKANGVLFPRIHIGSFQYTLAPDTGKNAGWVYVKVSKCYAGKINPETGRYFDIMQPLAVQAEVRRHIADPVAEMKVHGQQTGTCSCCGRDLIRKVSVFAAIGPICAEKYGIDQYEVAVANGMEAPAAVKLAHSRAPSVTLDDC